MSEEAEVPLEERDGATTTIADAEAPPVPDVTGAQDDESEETRNGAEDDAEAAYCDYIGEMNAEDVIIGIQDDSEQTQDGADDAEAEDVSPGDDADDTSTDVVPDATPTRPLTKPGPTLVFQPDAEGGGVELHRGDSTGSGIGIVSGSFVTSEGNHRISFTQQIQPGQSLMFTPDAQVEDVAVERADSGIGIVSGSFVKVEAGVPSVSVADDGDADDSGGCGLVFQPDAEVENVADGGAFGIVPGSFIKVCPNKMDDGSNDSDNDNNSNAGSEGSGSDASPTSECRTSLVFTPDAEAENIAGGNAFGIVSGSFTKVVVCPNEMGDGSNDSGSNSNGDNADSKSSDASPTSECRTSLVFTPDAEAENIAGMFGIVSGSFTKVVACPNKMGDGSSDSDSDSDNNSNDDAAKKTTTTKPQNKSTQTDSTSCSGSGNGSNNGTNNGSNNNKSSASSTPVPPAPPRSPYAVLNLPKSAVDHEVRDAYKRLSRCFHPDKRPPGKERDDAQEMFVELMNAYEILCDPALRLAYDEYGHDGVRFVRHNRFQPGSLHLTLTKIYEESASVSNDNGGVARGREEATRARMRTVLEHFAEERVREARRKEVRIGANVEVRSNWDDDDGSGNGGYPKMMFLGKSRLPEVASTGISLSAAVTTTTPGSATVPSTSGGGSNSNVVATGGGRPLTLSITGDSHVDQTGRGETSAALSASLEPHEDTQVTFECRTGTSQSRATLSTSRRTRDGTGLTAGVTKVVGSPALAVALSSQRPLFDRTLFATWNLGLGCPDLGLHFGAVSLTTLYDGYPRCTVEGRMKHPFPIAVSIDHDLDNDDDDDDDDDNNRHKDEHKNAGRRSGRLSLAWSPTLGLKIGAKLTRTLNRFSNYSVGLQHVGMGGLTWLFRWKRESITISVPIVVARWPSSTVMGFEYFHRVLFFASFSGILDEVLAEAVLFFQRRIADEFDKDCSGGGNDLGGRGGGGGEKRDKEDELAHYYANLNRKINALRNERQYMTSDDARDDALRQVAVMEGPARWKRLREERVGGLVILRATYYASSYSSGGGVGSSTVGGVEKGVKMGESLDVTTQLQFWVEESTLRLPKTSKSNLLGFYDVRRQQPKCLRDDEGNDDDEWTNGDKGFVGLCRTWFSRLLPIHALETGAVGRSACRSNDEARLKVRYKFEGSVYEITIDDDDVLELPSRRALTLGPSEHVS